MSSTRSSFRSLLAIVAAVALFAAACSSDTTTAAPTTTEAEAAETTTAAPTTTEAEPVEATTTTEAPASEVAFESGACAFQPPEAVDVECGWVTVPQNWDDPSDPDTIRLHVATFTRDTTPADAVPVVYLEGGPGGDALGLIAFTFDDLFGPIVDDHPMIVFTQRGSALTEVDLECEEVIDAELAILESVPNPEENDAQTAAAMAECAERLQAEGADLGAYHSVASANDADAIRAALGHEQWNVLGISYGTRLGQELARQHPDGIRALILDSVQPTDPNLGSLAALPQTFQGALNEFFAGCEANAECAAANPNLKDRLTAVLDELAANPIEVAAIDQLTGEEYDAIVDDERLLGLVFNALYSPETFAALPEMVEELEAGDTDITAALLGLQITNAPFISNGMYAAVMCHDFLAELTPASAWEAGMVDEPLFEDRFGGFEQDDVDAMCSAFPTGSADASIIEPVESDVPTLIMAGRYDPITPPSFAEAIAPGFSNGQTAILPHVGHGVVGNDCGMAIALDFLADPSSAADMSCIDSVDEPVWIPGSLEGTVFVAFEDPQLGVAGVHPENWIEQGFGVTVRDDANLAHQVALVQQGAPVGEGQLIGLLSGQIGEVVEAGTVDDDNGRTWNRWSIDEGPSSSDVYTFDDGGFTLLVLVQGAPDDLADAATHLVPTLLTEMQRL